MNPKKPAQAFFNVSSSCNKSILWFCTVVRAYVARRYNPMCCKIKPKCCSCHYHILTDTNPVYFLFTS